MMVTTATVPLGVTTRETGSELQLLFRMGFDATTFGNHEFDFGPDGLGTSIAVAAKAGRTPPIIAIDLSKDDPTLVDLQRLSQEGVLRRYLAIKRGGRRFGLFGLLGKDAAIYTSGGAASFPDATETARENGDDPAREGKGGCRPLSRRPACGERRTHYRGRRRELRQSHAKYRRRHQRAHSYRGA